MRVRHRTFRGRFRGTSKDGSTGDPLRPQLRPFAVKPSHLRRQRPYEVNRYMLTDNGELLLEADELHLTAVRLEPASPAMRMPTLPTCGSVGERNGSREKILNRDGHDCFIAHKENPARGAGLSVLLFGETFAGREGDLAELEDVNTGACKKFPVLPAPHYGQAIFACPSSSSTRAQAPLGDAPYHTATRAARGTRRSAQP
jgi:hypothetical protein